MLFGPEVLPLGLHFAVHFQFGVAFGVLEAELLINRDKVREEQRVYPFVLVFGFYGNEQQVERLGICLLYTSPSPRDTR